MSNKETIKLVTKAYQELAFLDNLDWTHHREELFRMTRDEEKGHRGWGPDFSKHHTSDTASIADCARLFAVKRIAEYLSGTPMPKGQDFLHIQKSCFYAAGLVDEYGEKIREAWKGFDLDVLKELDYCAVVHVREEAA